MVTSYGVIHIDSNKIKSLKDLKGRYNHNYRLEMPKNANPQLSDNNIIIKPPKLNNYVDTFKNIYEGLDYYKYHKLRKDGVIGVEVTTSITRGKMPPNFDLMKWGEVNINFLEKKFGEDNVLDGVMHLDETSPHIHSIILPIKDGKFNQKAFFNPYLLKSLQSEYEDEVTKSFGLKGRKKYAKASYITIQKFYEELNEHYEQELPRRFEKETQDEYYERVNEYYRYARLNDLKKVKNLEKDNHTVVDKLKNSMSDFYKLNQNIKNLLNQINCENEDDIIDKVKFYYGLQYGMSELKEKNKEEYQDMMDGIGKILTLGVNNDEYREIFEKSKTTETKERDEV